MISVNRSLVEKPDSLSKKGVDETRKAIEFYSDSANHTKSFSFKAYSASDVKLALDRLFHGKCAYCESVYASIHPMDVEHWRPKGLVTKREEGRIIPMVKPGYYWLAAEWTNLLPSCIDCNRQRYHQEAEASSLALILDADVDDTSPPDMSVLEAPIERDAVLRRVKRGKKNLFPVVGDRYASNPDAYAEQPDVPLLLNPCEDDVERFLEFVDGAVVRPTSELTAIEWEKAHQSIMIYGLNRSRLVYERKERVLQINAHIYTVRRLAVAYERLDMRRRNDKKVGVILQDIIEHEMRVLRRYMNADQPFAQMARQIVNDFFASF